MTWKIHGGSLICDCCVVTNPCTVVGLVLWKDNNNPVKCCLLLFSYECQGLISKDAAGFQPCWFRWKSLSIPLNQTGVILLLRFLQMGFLWIQSGYKVFYQSNFYRGKLWEILQKSAFFQMEMGSMWWYLWAVIYLSSEGRTMEGKLRNVWISLSRDPRAASRQCIPLSQLLIQEHKSGCILPLQL